VQFILRKLINFKMNKEEELKNIMLAIAIIMGFVFIVSISIFYIKENYATTCSCNTPINFIIITLTSLGVFIGVLTYYFLSNSFFKQKEKLFFDAEKTLNFLDLDERKIIEVLIKNKGSLAQNKLSKESKLDSVKLHRRLNNLENKEIILKQKKGMTNTINLKDEFKAIFIK